MPERRAFAVAAALLLASTATGGQTASETVRGTFVGWSEVDATGRVVTFTPDGSAAPSVVQALRSELAKQVFTPSRDPNGSARPVRTYLSGRYVLKPDSEGWMLRIDEVRAGPKLVTVVMPRAQSRIFITGESVWMRVAMTVQPDGRPAELEFEVLQGTEEIQREAREALSKWRFEPEMIAGRPIATRVRQEYSMRLEDKPELRGPPCPEDSSGRVLAAGQNSCLPEVQSMIRMLQGRRQRIDPR